MMERFVDAGCRLGRPQIPDNQPWQTEKMLELMDRCRIEKAIVHHVVALEGSILEGNKLTVQAAAECDRFIPQWCIMPNAFEEFMDAHTLHAALKENGVTTFRIAPLTYDHSIQPWAMGQFMDLAAACHIPVFLDYYQAPKDNLHTLCSTYPDVRFVITATAYQLNRWLGPILDCCNNLYVGTGNYVVHRGLKTFCERYGAERLLFTSGLPTGSATAAVSLLCLSELSREQKELIAYGNIETMLSEVRL